jgi:hypothetical protein
MQQTWIEFEWVVRGVIITLDGFGQWLRADLPYCADHTAQYYLTYRICPSLTYALFFTPYERADFALQLTTSAEAEFSRWYHEGIVRMIAQDLYSALERRGFSIKIESEVIVWELA